MAVVGPAGDQGLGCLAERLQRTDVRGRAAEVPLLRADAGDEHLVRSAHGSRDCGLRMGRRPVQRGGRQAEGDGVEDLAGHGHREHHVRDAACGLRQPGDKPGAFFFAEPEEGLDGRAVRRPLEQGGGVDRGVVGVFDPETGGGQPVQRAGPAEYRPGSRRQPPAGCASSSASATQRLSFFDERLIEADRAERVLDQIPAVDRLDLRIQREGENGVPDLAGVAGGEDDQVLTVSPVGERVKDGEHGRARGHRDRDLPVLVLEAELGLTAPLGRGPQEEH